MLKYNETYRGYGVYKIKNRLNNDCYIGSSFNVFERWKVHYKKLKINKHHSIILQRAFNKYKEQAFEFELIEKCNTQKDKLIQLEQKYMDNIKPKYNICPIAGSSLGVKHSKEFGQKITLRQLGRPSKLKGTTKSNEFKQKISLATRGKKNPFYGKKHSIEVKKIIKQKRKLQIMKNLKSVIRYEIEDGKITEYKSLTQAALDLNLKTSSNLSGSCKGKRTAQKSFWFYSSQLNLEELKKRFTSFLIRKIA